MLTNTSTDIAISNIGWVDRGNLWIFRFAEQREQLVALGDAKYLTLHAGTDDYFSVVQHHEGARVEISVHTFDDVGTSVGRAVVEADRSFVSGSPSVWAHVQTNYTAYYKGPFWSDFALIQVDPVHARVSLQQFPWYNDGYDKDYQGIVGVTEVPGDSLLAISVQRDSRVVLYDPVERTKRGTIELAGRGGNPSLYFRRRANELWAQDYDTLVKLECPSWRVLDSSRLQTDDRRGARQFVGEFWFDPDETMCVVARPFSGDVVGLDPTDLRTRFQCKIGQKPLEAVVLRDGAVVARDWKTGKLMRGQIDPLENQHRPVR